MAEHQNPIAAWDPKHDAELETQDRETTDTIAQVLGGASPDASAPTGMHARLMDRLRDKAVVECVRQLDAILQTIDLSTTTLPTAPLAVDDFGQLSFGRVKTDNDPAAQVESPFLKGVFLAADLLVRGSTTLPGATPN